MASRSVNKVILIGHLGKDAETKFTPNGVPRTTFSLATSHRWKDQSTGEWKEETDWHNIVYWRAENVANYLQKGKQVYIEGRLRTHSYEKEGQKHFMTEVIIDELILLSGRGESGGEGGGDFERSERPVSMPRSARPQSPAAPAAPAAPAEDFNQGITDDDVPF